MKRFIDLAVILKEMRNYNGAMEIFSGLDSNPVSRLRDNMDVILSHKKYVNLLSDLKALFNPKKNYEKLRETIIWELETESSSSKPKLVIPHVGLILSDIVAIEEKNPKFLGGTSFLTLTLA